MVKIKIDIKQKAIKSWLLFPFTLRKNVFEAKKSVFAQSHIEYKNFLTFHLKKPPPSHLSFLPTMGLLIPVFCPPSLC